MEWQDQEHRQTQVPDPSFLQTALGAAATGAGIYGALRDLNMNRTLRRPMFRRGGSTGTGITSGLDQPRKQYANGSRI